MSLDKMYQRRFGADIEFRKGLWSVLCKDFFQKYIPKEAVILEVAAGYCEFINNIVGKRKIALDLNPDVKKFASGEVEVVLADSINMLKVADNSCDVVFISNFLEHLKKEDIVKTVKDVHRVLRIDGKLLILQPNIRFCYKEYWNFFDHISALDDKSLSEVLELNGLKVIECKPKFLPYTTKSRFPKAIFLIKLYLRVPILQNMLGKQAFICARK